MTNTAAHHGRRVRNGFAGVSPSLRPAQSGTVGRRALRFSPFPQPVLARRVVAGAVRMRPHKRSSVRLNPTKRLAFCLIGRRLPFCYRLRSEENHEDIFQLYCTLLRAEWKTDFRSTGSRATGLAEADKPRANTQLPTFPGNNSQKTNRRYI